LTIRTGEPPEIPKAESEGNLGDGRLVLTAGAKKSPGLMQSTDAKVLDGRQAIASLKRGSESSLRHASLSSQIRDGQCLVGTAHGKFYGRLRLEMPTNEVTACGMLTPREKTLSRRQ
jgi:hypothetical protein